MQDIWICVTYPFFSLFTAGPKKAKKDLLTCLRHTYDYFDTDPGQDDAIYADGQPDFVSVRQRCFRSNWEPLILGKWILKSSEPALNVSPLPLPALLWSLPVQSAAPPSTDECFEEPSYPAAQLFWWQRNDFLDLLILRMNGQIARLMAKDWMKILHAQ